jgi:hypothetical protein
MSDEEQVEGRSERMRMSVEAAQAALDAIRKVRAEFGEAEVALIRAQLTPNPKASMFRQSTLHQALRPFTQLGAKLGESKS